MALFGIFELFILGVLTPLTAVCVLPLYPAFLAYLANMDDKQVSIRWLATIVVGGVLTFMGLVGVIFAFILEVSITTAVEVVSPIGFVLLTFVGAVLTVNPNGFARLPVPEAPQSRSPRKTAFGYGFFFGAIILPCNPGLIALLFARAPVLFDSGLQSFAGFLSFGLGIGAPLFVFAIISEPYSRSVTRTLARYSSHINRGLGLIFVMIGLYYLIFVFNVVPLL